MKSKVVRIEEAIIEDKELSNNAKLLYIILRKYAGNDSQECTVRIKELAEGLQRSVRTVQYLMNELIEKGIVVRILRKTNFYPSKFILDASCYREK